MSLLRIVMFWRFNYPDAWNGVSPADFPNYYFPGGRLWRGEPLYADLAEEVKRSLGWSYDVYPADPPFALILFAPLHLLDYKIAWHIFLMLSFCSVGYAIYLSSRTVGWGTLASITAMCIGLSSAPALFLFKRNHFESLLLLAAVFGWRQLHLKKDPPYWWSFAAALKLFPFAWILYAGRYLTQRVFVRLTLLFLSLTALGVLCAGVSNSADFLQRIVPQAARWYGVVGNYSLIGFFSAFQLTSVGFVSSALFFAYTLQRKWWMGTEDDLYVKAVCLSLILSPLSWMNYQILLLPPLLILFDKVREESSALRVLWYLAAIIIWGFPGYLETNTHLGTVLLGFCPLYATGALFFLSHKLIGDRTERIPT